MGPSRAFIVPHPLNLYKLCLEDVFLRPGDPAVFNFISKSPHSKSKAPLVLLLYSSEVWFSPAPFLPCLLSYYSPRRLRVLFKTGGDSADKFAQKCPRAPGCASTYSLFALRVIINSLLGLQVLKRNESIGVKCVLVKIIKDAGIHALLKVLLFSH